jgi:hypothetical protein
MSNLNEVFEKWASDASFKHDFKKDPVQTLENAGLKLSEDDLKKVLAYISNQEELEKKINK